MSGILYSNGDSVVWGSELDKKEKERFSYLTSKNINYTDCNQASAGVSNDYIYRTTMRDISNWIRTKKIWTETTNWVASENLIVMIGWTSPTRFEIWDGEKYVQERLWESYDKWGNKDLDNKTEINFILNQTDIIPSYTKTFNYILGLSNFLKSYNIPYYFFNVFYKYKSITEPKNLIDKFKNKKFQVGYNSIYELLPNSFKDQTMYDYLKTKNGTFLPRKHPSKISHQIWSEYLIKNVLKKNENYYFWR